MTPWHWPAEWEPQAGVWIGWPSHADLWREQLEGARQEVAALARAVAWAGKAAGWTEPVAWLAAASAEAAREAREALGPIPARVVTMPFGDIWFRDIAPIFGRAHDNHAPRAFVFNGWGGKYAFPEDQTVPASITRTLGLPLQRFAWILEGGAVEGDGAGTVLTTRQCLLNPNRNAGATEAQVTRWLREGLGAESVLWLDSGLAYDHTDGHVDNIARFVAPGRVVCQRPTGSNDPNVAVLGEIEGRLRSFRDARGRPLAVHPVPSPGLVRDVEGQPMAASYVNFLITNGYAVVPQYGVAADRAALLALQRALPGYRILGLPAWNLLHGGGAFHCITQQVPAVPGQTVRFPFASPADVHQG